VIEADPYATASRRHSQVRRQLVGPRSARQPAEGGLRGKNNFENPQTWLGIHKSLKSPLDLIIASVLRSPVCLVAALRLGHECCARCAIARAARRPGSDHKAIAPTRSYCDAANWLAQCPTSVNRLRNAMSAFTSVYHSIADMTLWRRQ